MVFGTATTTRRRGGRRTEPDPYHLHKDPSPIASRTRSEAFVFAFLRSEASGRDRATPPSEIGQASNDLPYPQILNHHFQRRMPHAPPLAREPLEAAVKHRRPPFLGPPVPVSQAPKSLFPRVLDFNCGIGFRLWHVIFHKSDLVRFDLWSWALIGS